MASNSEVAGAPAQQSSGPYQALNFVATMNIDIHTDLFEACVRRMYRDGVVKFFCFAPEFAATGQAHYQCFLGFPKKTTVFGAAKILNPLFRAMGLPAMGYIAGMRGTLSQNEEYCSKSAVMVTVGDVPVNPGTRERGRWHEIRDLCVAGRFDDCMEQFPLESIRYGEQLRLLEVVIPECPSIVLHQWQEQIMFYLMTNAPSPRRVLVVVDPRGGRGKSTFCRYLVASYLDVEMFRDNGRPADIALMVKRPTLAIFDLTRSGQTAELWSIIEQIADGAVMNAKYMSRMKFFPSPYVIVFTNTEMPRGALSQDRVFRMELSIDAPCGTAWTCRNLMCSCHMPDPVCPAVPSTGGSSRMVLRVGGAGAPLPQMVAAGPDHAVVPLSYDSPVRPDYRSPLDVLSSGHPRDVRRIMSSRGFGTQDSPLLPRRRLYPDYLVETSCSRSRFIDDEAVHSGDDDRKVEFEDLEVRQSDIEFINDSDNETVSDPETSAASWASQEKR
nr:replication-associated protein [Cressdnaviricota sp.]